MSDPWKTCSLFLPSFLLILRFILLFIIFTFAPSFLSASLNPLPSFWAVALKEQIRRWAMLSYSILQWGNLSFSFFSFFSYASPPPLKTQIPTSNWGPKRFSTNPTISHQPKHMSSVPSWPAAIGHWPLPCSPSHPHIHFRAMSTADYPTHMRPFYLSFFSSFLFLREKHLRWHFWYGLRIEGFHPLKFLCPMQKKKEFFDALAFCTATLQSSFW